MGHDIYARPIDNSKEVAYIRYAAFDNRVEQAYKILKAEKHNMQLSGDGKKKTYTLKEMSEIRLEIASKHLPYYSDLYEFMGEIIHWMHYSGMYKIEIWFC